MGQPQNSPGEEQYGITPELAADAKQAILARDRNQLFELVAPLHAADTADLLEQIDPELRQQAVAILGSHLDSEVISELNESVRNEILGNCRLLSWPKSFAIWTPMTSSTLVEDLAPERQKAALSALGDAERAVIEQSLHYPEDSAGRLMQREIVMVPSHWNVGAAIDYMRSQAELPEEFYHLFLTDPKAKIRGNGIARKNHVLQAGTVLDRNR